MKELAEAGILLAIAVIIIIIIVVVVTVIISIIVCLVYVTSSGKSAAVSCCVPVVMSILHTLWKDCCLKAQELCESRGGCPCLPVPNSPYGLCGRKATLKLN